MRFNARQLLMLGFAALGVPVLEGRTQVRQSSESLIGPAQVLATELELTNPVDVGIYDDGSFLILDFQSTRVTRVSPTGRTLWQFGRPGSGPGEFRVPYRVALRSDQSALVFDMVNSRATLLDSKGQLLSTYPMPFRIEMSNVVSLPSGEIAIAGIARDPRAREFAIHLFTSTLSYLRSFGPLPEVESQVDIRTVGAGGLTLGLNGELVHTRAYPLEVRRFNADGAVRQIVSLPLRVDGPKQLESRSEQNGRVSRRDNASAVRVGPAYVLRTGEILALRHTTAGDSVSLFTAAGRLLASSLVGDAETRAVSIDLARSRMLLQNTHDDFPRLMWAPINSRVLAKH